MLVTKKKVEKKIKENCKKEDKSVFFIKDEHDKVSIDLMRI